MKIARILLLGTVFVATALFTEAQVGINSTGSPPHGSAILDVSSTAKGVLVPRMTKAQRDAISSPATGLLVYQTDNMAGYYYYAGANWVSVEGAGAGSNSTSTCIDYDGNAYPTFQIGTQVWMAENLRVAHYRNGDVIPNVTDNAAWDALTTGAYCLYNNQAGNELYGLLYNWYAVDDSRGLCPVGWHEPSDAEWTTLTSYLGGELVAGGKMKSVSELWNSPNTRAINSSGFSGLPGGTRDGSGSFNDVTIRGYWWTSTGYDEFSYAWYRYLVYYNELVYRNDYGGSKGTGFSVRCLRDY